MRPPPKPNSWPTRADEIFGKHRAGRCPCQRGHATKIAADAAGAQRSLLAAPLPALPVVRGDRPGEAELGEGGDDDPGPAVHLLRVAQCGVVPAQALLCEPVSSPGVSPGADGDCLTFAQFRG